MSAGLKSDKNNTDEQEDGRWYCLLGTEMENIPSGNTVTLWNIYDLSSVEWSKTGNNKVSS